MYVQTWAPVTSSGDLRLRRADPAPGPLDRQTAAVDAVSGATYTSLSYEGSLQSALDKLGFKASDGSVAGTDMSALQ